LLSRVWLRQQRSTLGGTTSSGVTVSRYLTTSQ
jgi:hypothetical protein